jgi:hypothetical protein
VYGYAAKIFCIGLGSIGMTASEEHSLLYPE